MQIIKDETIIENRWRHLADDEIAPEGCITVSYRRWKTERRGLIERDGELGLRLTGDDPIEALADDFNYFQLIVLEIPKMTDGRCFSLARLIRERYGFAGELRASGHFIRDQIFFLARVGVNAFEYQGPHTLEELLSAFNDYTVKYQAAFDEKKPLYRRRHRPS